MSRPPATHRADERRFLDERWTSAPVAPNGLNPARILEKAVVDRIVNSYFWKEQCFGVNEADVVDRVADHVHFIGGTYGVSQKPTPFLCLTLKLLQLAPDDDILQEYLGIGGERFKYLRALACFYVRLTRPAKQVHELLEPYLEDYRKLRRRAGPEGKATLTYIDEFVDDLLTKDRVCATSLWKMPPRDVLEDRDGLEPRVSPLGDIEDLLAESEEEKEGAGGSGKDDDEERSGDERDRESRGGSSRRESSESGEERDRRWNGEGDDERQPPHGGRRSSSGSGSGTRSPRRRESDDYSDDDRRRESADSDGDRR